MYFVDTSLSVKYNKKLKDCCFFCMKYTTLGESLSTQLCLCCICHLTLIGYTGKFWQTIKVKAIGEENFGDYAKVSAHAKYFLVYL